MDVYHKVLVRIFESSGGKESVMVDLREIVKKEGFLPSLVEIKEHLSRQSWITEAGRGDSVSITHWGIKEARSAAAGGDSSNTELKRTINRAISETTELSAILAAMAEAADPEATAKAEKKAGEIVTLISTLRNLV